MSLQRPPRARLDAVTVYLIITGATALFGSTIFTLAAIYRVQEAGLTPLQLVLVGTMMEASIFLFEVPTGVVADTFSRRASVITGIALLGAASVQEGAVPLFGSILLAQALWGLGYTFTSGATEAWISGE
ncbi:MAG: MFS transporter, partial [Chloroflexota bacterium]|nr:MFS transporter [Chloroflexota bacterium]